MFEKEAIRHAFEDTIGVECLIKPVEDFTYEELSDEQQEKTYDFKKGAEFGYNKDNKNDCELLKSLLYCTIKSCNNCGKVNCENFQRQRIDCCSLWVSYKDYIAKLEKENAELKTKKDTTTREKN